MNENEKIDNGEAQDEIAPVEPVATVAPGNKFVNFLKEWVPSILIAFALWYILSSFVIQSVRIPTESMVPTILPEDRVMVLKFLYFDKLEHNDIVVFYPPVPGSEDVPYIKRLVGLAGDKIEVKDGMLYRNDVPINEPFINAPMNYTFGPVEVPPDSYFFLGDNRNNSRDAHDPVWTTPFVKHEDVIGKGLFRFYPLPRFGAID
jgi:signal peptidase I